MTELTLQKNYELLIDLTEYVKTELPKILDTRFEQVDGRLDQIDGRLDQMDRRFEQIDGRLDQMDRRFEQIDGRLDQMDRRFDQVDGRFAGIDGRFVGIDGRLEFMGHTIQSILHHLANKADKSEVAEIKENVDYIITILDGMCKKQEEMHTEQKAFSAGFYRLKKKVDVLEKKIDA